MRLIALSVLCFAAVAAIPANHERIVGGTVTTIEQWPQMVALLYSRDLTVYWQSCGGVILNNRAVLSAAHCTFGDPAVRWRFRVGSTWANSGGVVHVVFYIIHHPHFTNWVRESDLSIVHSTTTIVHNDAARPASIAGANYNLADNQVVWATGWGSTSSSGPPSEQLRQVQIWTVNQAICAARYAPVGRVITDNMLCAGWLDVGGRDQCQGDSGGPVYHNGVVVGVCSFGQGCALPHYPGVNTRVSRYTDWIQANA